MVDPWGGFNDSMKNLNDTFVRVRQEDRQGELDAQRAALFRQQLAMGNIQLQDAQRKQQDTLDARAALAGLQPTTKDVTYEQQGPAQPVPNPTYAADRAALAGQIQAAKAQTYDPSKSYGDNDLPPGQTQLTPEATAAQQQRIAPLQAKMDALQTHTAGEPLQPVTQQQTVPVTTEQRIAALTEHAMKTGDYDPVTKAINMEGILAKRKVELEQAGGDMTAYVKAQADLAASKELLSTITPLLAKGQAGRQMAANYLAAFKAAHPGNQMVQNAQLDDYKTDDTGTVQAVRDPQTGQVLGHYIMNPGKGEMEFKASTNAESAHNVQELTSPDGKTAQKFQYNPKTQRYDIPLGPAYKVKSQVANININGGGGDEADVAAWAKAIKEGRANLQDVPNRGTMRSRVVKSLEAEGGTDYAAGKAENAAYGATVTALQKQRASMGSFVKNLDAQVQKVNELSQKLKTFDTRLLNVPLRAVRGKIAGSPDQAKYDMYLTEIESEIGKLATGSTGSVAELSQGAQAKWEKIHDKNLSVSDMLELLKETSAAGKLRMKSVEDQLNETRQQRKGKTAVPSKSGKSVSDFWN